MKIMQTLLNVLLLTQNKFTSFNLELKKNRRGFSSKIFMKKGNFNNEIIYTPKTVNQKLYLDYLNNKKNDLIVAVGPAGSGKTMFACLKAMESLKKNDVNKIILTRPVVPVEEDIGFLPGNIVKKMDPWTRPIFDLFLEYYSQNEITQMINNGIIEISPLAYMRGRTFKNAFIIADEMQNSSPNQMMMLTTRIGTNSRMVITGDLQQSDKLIDNGLKDFISKYNYFSNNDFNNNNSSEIKIVYLNNSDVLRSAIVQKVLNIYNFKKPIINNSTQIITKNIKNSNNDAALIPAGQFHGGF
jgi:phosphate starvation-inducible PhoH-like protein